MSYRLDPVQIRKFIRIRKEYSESEWIRFHNHCQQINMIVNQCVSGPQGADPPPPSSARGKAGRNNLNEEITPFLPIGIGERYSQTISNLGHAALMWTPPGGEAFSTLISAPTAETVRTAMTENAIDEQNKQNQSIPTSVTVCTVMTDSQCPGSQF